jgi:hypothetical protein
LLGTEYTYKYIAQSSGAYGSDVYGAGTYSCASNDTVCQAGGPGAPNTGFLASSNPVLIGGVFITVALVVTVVVYAIIRKVNRSKAQK